MRPIPYNLDSKMAERLAFIRWLVLTGKLVGDGTLYTDHRPVVAYSGKAS